MGKEKIKEEKKSKKNLKENPLPKMKVGRLEKEKSSKENHMEILQEDFWRRKGENEEVEGELT